MRFRVISIEGGVATINIIGGIIQLREGDLVTINARTRTHTDLTYTHYSGYYAT